MVNLLFQVAEPCACPKLWHPCIKHAKCVVHPDYLFNPTKCQPCLNMYKHVSAKARRRGNITEKCRTVNQAKKNLEAQSNITKWYTCIRSARVNGGICAEEDGYNFWCRPSVEDFFCSIVPTKNMPKESSADVIHSAADISENVSDTALNSAFRFDPVLDTSLNTTLPSSNMDLTIANLYAQKDALAKQIEGMSNTVLQNSAYLSAILQQIAERRDSMEGCNMNRDLGKSGSMIKEVSSDNDPYVSSDTQNSPDNELLSPVTYYAPKSANISLFQGSFVIIHNNNLIAASNLDIVDMASKPFTYRLRKSVPVSAEIKILLEESTEKHFYPNFNGIVRDSFPLFDCFPHFLVLRS